MSRQVCHLMISALFIMLFPLGANAQFHPETRPTGWKDAYFGGNDQNLPTKGLGKTLALICVADNDFYLEEVFQYEVDEWIGKGVPPPFATQDRDGFPAMGLFAYYQLRLTGCSDDDIIFMLWHDDEPGNSMCEIPVNLPDNDDGAILGGGDQWIDYDGDGFDDLDGIDTDGDLIDDLLPVIDYENDDPSFPAMAVTKDNFVAALENLAGQATRFDHVIIYMVGHGVRTASEPTTPVSFAFESGEATPETDDDGITDVEFNDLMISLFSGPEAPQVTVLADFCYSGRFIRPGKRISVWDWDSAEPRVAVSGDTVHVVWQDNRIGNPRAYEVYYRKSEDGGVTWSQEDCLSVANYNMWSTDGFESMHPCVVVSGDYVHVFWDDEAPYASGGWLTEIYYRRSTDGGETWESIKRLTDKDSKRSAHPDAGVSGSYVQLVWSDHRDYSGGTTSKYKSDIYYMRSNGNGLAWSDDERLTDSDAASQRPRVATAGSYIHVTWHDTRHDPEPGVAGALAEIYYKRGEGNGIDWSDAEGNYDDANNKYDKSISTIDGWDSRNADIAARNKKVYIAWQDEAALSNGSAPEIHMRRSDDRGALFIPNVFPYGWPNISWPGKDETPAIDLRSENEVHVVWDTVWDVDTAGMTLPGAGQLRDLVWEGSRDAGNEMFGNGLMDNLLTFHFDANPPGGGDYLNDTATPDLRVTNNRFYFVWSDGWPKIAAANREILFRAAPYYSIWMPASGDVAAKYYMEASTSTHPSPPAPYGAYAGSFLFYGFWWSVDGTVPLEPCWLMGLSDAHIVPGIGLMPTEAIQPTGGCYMDYPGKGLEVIPGGN